MKPPTVVEFVTDPQLLGLTISPAQETLLRVIYGLPLVTDEQRALFRDCTGRTTYREGHAFPEATVLSGARGGKDSRIAAPIVCYQAVFGGHERYLHKGERGIIPLVAQDARGARIAFGYIKDYLTKSPMLASMVADEPLASEITLTNGLTVTCFPCTLRSLRGWSMPTGVMDEVGFWRLEGQADSDVEVQTSIRRGMIAFPSTRLVKISTPYMKSGILYEDFKRGFGQDDPDLLVWRASSRLMNPTITADRLERERRLDPVRFAREYEAEFAEDVDAFLSTAWVEGAVVAGRYELPPQVGLTYVVAVDPSGGGPDAFPLAIVHAEGAGAQRRIVQDVMRGWSKPRGDEVNLESVVAEITALAKAYRVTAVHGDRYAKGWVREAFQRHGLRYVDAAIKGTYLDKSSAYLEVEPLFAQGAIDILDHPTLIRELKLLERRPTVGGRDRVDHPRGQHDDHANALAIASAIARGAETSFAPLVSSYSKNWTPRTSAAGQGATVEEGIVVRTAFGLEPFRDPRGDDPDRPMPAPVTHDVDSVAHRTECRSCRRTWRSR
jgi:hypothetical protein